MIEGIGDYKDEGTKSFYTDYKKIKYEGKTLKAIECKDFDKKFTAN